MMKSAFGASLLLLAAVGLGASALVGDLRADDLSTGTCVFKNDFSFPYLTNVEYGSADLPTLEEACEVVLSCLNNPLCLRYDSPDARSGWILDSYY